MSSLLTPLSGPFWHDLVVALLHTMWQGALVAGLLLVILRTVGTYRPGLRYGSSLGALATVVLLGMLSWAVLDYGHQDTGDPPQPLARVPVAPVGSVFGTGHRSQPSIFSQGMIRIRAARAISCSRGQLFPRRSSPDSMMRQRFSAATVPASSPPWMPPWIARTGRVLRRAP